MLVTASFMVGFVASIVSNPVYVIKMRVLNMKVEAGRDPLYKGVFRLCVEDNES